MDCKEFNDCLTEYEARKLSKSKEAEFLEHKNSCTECNEIFELVTNQDILYSFEDLDFENNVVRDTIMDTITGMEYKGYNFKKSNILNITFGSIFIGFMMIMVVEASKNPLSAHSNAILSSVEKFALFFENGSILLMNAYVQHLWYVIFIFVVSAFSISVLECKRLRNRQV